MEKKYRYSMYNYDILNQSVSKQLNKPVHEVVKSEDRNQCGYGSFQPKCLQPCTSIIAFTVVYFLASIQFGLFFVYLLNTLTTVEKHFHLKSKSTGIIIASYEVGYLLSILPISIYAGQRHRPRFIGLGIFGVMIASLLYTFPYFIYGPPHIDVLAQGNTTSNTTHDFCNPGSVTTNQPSTNCSDDSHAANNSALGLFIFSIIVYGFSSAAITSLGFPFIDDNAAKEKSGFYLGLVMFSRLIGPILGFLLGALTMTKYIDLSNPGFGPGSIHWIGAWWLGFLIIAATMPFSGILMLGFPRKLQQPDLKGKKSTNERKHPKIKMKEVPATIRNLLGNPVLVSRILGDTFAVLGFMGFLSFMNKYVETKFQIAVHKSNLWTGPVFMAGFACGILLGSCIVRIKRVKLRHLALMICFASGVWSIGLLVLMNIECPAPVLNNNWNLHSLNISDACVDMCGCNSQKFNPVCDITNMVSYYSPCHAGCDEFDKINKTFLNCHCSATNSTVIDGLCTNPCESIFTYIGVLFIMFFIGSIPAVGNTLITLRSIPPHLKSIGLGLEMMIVGLFAVIPSPIIYGAQADSSCLIWERSGCSDGGSCKMYDSDQFRIRFHLFGVIVSCCAMVPNFICWFKSRTWKFSHEEDDVIEDANEEITIFEKYRKESKI